ncbi:MAG: T9SS type A sorting domain-containing protein [Chitinophagales bacterium]|nr:T9SS type A sorting domain-containing protein [Chitinophagales bacterium]MDW8427936.1 T9SS type A sorting domain-containing protein [Chitinophagales bacterium]
MRIFLLTSILSFTLFSAQSAIVTGIHAEYRHGQVFVTWKVIPNYEHKFYYVYRYEKPITNQNIDSAEYLGRSDKEFSFNYFLNLGITGSNTNKLYYCVINNDPWVVLDATDGLYVHTCNKDKSYYYAVTCDSTVFGTPKENKRIVPGMNATTMPVAEKVAQIRAYLQVTGIPLLNNPSLTYDGYALFQGKVKTPYVPYMGNEGCLIHNWGLIKDTDLSPTKNAATFFFYGGGGNAYDNANGTNIANMWKISMEDVLPNFNWDPVSGENTKWLGYNENLDIYTLNQTSPPPTSGVDRMYTVWRVKWTYDWLLRTFPNDIDTTRIAAFGSSNGCTAALILAYLYPDKISAVDVTNAKINPEYLTDDNPTCKWNINGTSRNRAEIFLGTLQANLMSDVPRLVGTGNYPLYEFSNLNNLVADNKYSNIPPVFMTSGKADNVTCWEEKIQFYNTVNKNRVGGAYFWDERQHKGGVKYIKDRPLELLLRFRTDLPFPAFSRCSHNNNPGDTDNPTAPFYDGDTIGAINGILDWDDSSIAETDSSWQTKIFTTQFELNNGTWFPPQLPDYVTVDITPRRLKKFTNLAPGTKLCMENWQDGVLIQSRTVKWTPSADGKGLITFRKARISQQGNLIKIFVCDQQRNNQPETGPAPQAMYALYPNPATDVVFLELSLSEPTMVHVTIRDVAGKLMFVQQQKLEAAEDQTLSIPVHTLPQGLYLVTVHEGNQPYTYRLVKQ